LAEEGKRKGKGKEERTNDQTNGRFAVRVSVA
jgi:hypothetical protein